MSAARVQLVRWPDDAELRSSLAADGVPRILLVPDGVRPPAIARDEDWIRTPADEHELWSRMQRLARLTQVLPPPVLRDEVVLAVGDASVVLSDSEAELARPLVAQFGHLVLRADLEAQLFPHGAPNVRTFDSRVHRLRQRVRAVDLTIHTIRGRGIALDHAPEEDPWLTS